MNKVRIRVGIKQNSFAKPENWTIISAVLVEYESKHAIMRSY